MFGRSKQKKDRSRSGHSTPNQNGTSPSGPPPPYAAAPYPLHGNPPLYQQQPTAGYPQPTAPHLGFVAPHPNSPHAYTSTNPSFNGSPYPVSPGPLYNPHSPPGGAGYVQQPMPIMGTPAYFDAGAEFSATNPPNIPPPPPGVAPNTAQLAMMGVNPAPGQGPTVVKVVQKKRGFFDGSGGGGYTFW